MPDIQINCRNPWHDYTGGADHWKIADARACEAEFRPDKFDDGPRTHVVIITLDEYERLIGEGDDA